MVRLHKINEQNFNECVGLKVKDSQKGFVADNVYSLAQAWLHCDIARPFAIYDDDAMVGFIMFDYDENDDECGVWRFMIDEKYQGEGRGKAAMAAALEYIKQNPSFCTARLSYEPANAVAEKLYLSFGFIPTGKVIDGEIEMVLKLK